MRIIYYCLTLLAFPILVTAQCYDQVVPILDLNVTTVQIPVENATNNDLSSPSQGVCGIFLNFEHEFVGQLIFELTSPSGQTVVLIGPSSTSSFTLLNPSFDISFVPDAQTAYPDPGFDAQWTNDQDWTLFGDYTGSYYPFLGSLEDFNTGPINGLWSLVIRDTEVFYTGQLLSFTILFCDQAGVDCDVCYANAGNILNSNLSYCQGDPNLNITPDLEFPGGMADPNLYDFQYVVTENDTVLEYRDDLDFSAHEPGVYHVCALSVDVFETNLLPTDFGNFRIEVIENMIDTGFCADISNNCFQVDIYNSLEPVIREETLCPGTSIVINNEIYSDVGFYEITLPASQPLCDSIIHLTLNDYGLEVNIFSPDSLFCGDTISIFADVISPGGPPTFLWETFEGNIIGNTSDPVITVDQQGTYYLYTSDGSCTDTSVFVLPGYEFPIAFAEGGSIDCGMSSLELDADFFPSDVSYYWEGPSGFTSTDQTPIVSEFGEYVFWVTNSFGCTATDTAFVIPDTIAPSIFISSMSPNCALEFTNVSLSSNIQNPIFFWDGPNNYSFIGSSANLVEDGTYNISLSSGNGCVDSISFMISGDYQVPDIQVSSDTIDCLTEMVTLNTTASNQNLSYNWFGPGGFNSNQSDPEVILSGFYYLTVTAPNGCTNTVQHVVQRDDELFNLTLPTDTISCAKDSAIIGIDYPDAVSYEWSGPNNYSSNTNFTTVTDAGYYILRIEDSNGCIGNFTQLVVPDLNIPFVRIYSDTLDCNTNATQLDLEIFSEFDSLLWTGPSNFESLDTFPIVQEAGIYELVLIGENGCVGNYLHEVQIDTSRLDYLLEFDKLGCEDSIELYVFSPDAVEIFWEDINGVITFDQLIYAHEVGFYTVSVTGENGCSSVQSVEVVLADGLPELSLSAEDINCLNAPVSITPSIVNGVGTTYEWTFNDQIIGTNPEGLASESGWYFSRIVTEDNCIIKDSIFIDVDTIAPNIINIEAGLLPCSGDGTQIIVSTTDVIISYEWSGPNNYVSDQIMAEVFNEGMYYINLVGENGCTSTDSIFVQADPNTPVVSAFGPNLNCVDTIVQIFASSNDDISSYTWTGPNDFSSSEQNPFISEVGSYFVQGTGSNGCLSNIFEITISEEIDTPIAIASSTEMIYCDGNQIQLDGSASSQGLLYNYQWTTIDGSIVSNANTLNPTIDQAGSYVLEVINNETSCSTFDTILILYEMDGLLDMVLDIQESSCLSAANGEVSIIDVIGGLAPYEYSSDGINFSSENTFSSTTDGNVSVYVRDARNCILDSLVFIGTGNPLTVDLGPDITINIGEEVLIDFDTNVPIAQIDTIEWTSNPNIDCINCQSLNYSPSQSTAVIITITDIYGCMATDIINIIVENNDKVYVPNVFTPNNDGINDFISVYGNQYIEEIISFTIYDRWGEIVFEEKSFQVNDESVKWEGKLASKAMLPAVFVYRLLYLDKAGKVKEQTGDITLLN